MRKNIETLFKGRKPPTNKNVGRVIMIDGVAIEQAIRFDFPDIEGDKDDGNASQNLAEESQNSGEADEFTDMQMAIDLQEFHGRHIEAEDLNPAPKKSAPHYLNIDGDQYYLPRLINELLSTDKERRQLVTLRPLCARGVTREESL